MRRQERIVTISGNAATPSAEAPYSWRQQGADRRREAILNYKFKKVAEAQARREAVKVRRVYKEQEARMCIEVHLIFDCPTMAKYTPKAFERNRRDNASTASQNHSCYKLNNWRQKGADRRRDAIKKNNGVKAAEAKARQEAVRVRREKKEQERLSKAVNHL